MEDDIDIYEDLPSFETKECEANKELTEECSKLREENAKLKEDVVKFGANMSSLLKTAKAEIARKDKMIAQLRRELDNAAFRRGNYGARRNQNINKPKFKKLEQNTEKTQQTPPIKEEALQENAATGLDDISDEEDMLDVGRPAPIDHQDKLTSTVFGARLKNKLLLEQEAERIKKEEARIALLAVPIKVEKVGDTELETGNGFIKKEDPKDASQDTSNTLTEKVEVPVVSSLPQSSALISELHQEDDNAGHRRAPKRNLSENRDLSEKRDFSANSEQSKRRRVEDERYWREEDARQHHNGNFKYDDVRYNSDGFENSDYSKTSTKYTDPRRTGHNRDDYDRARYKVRDGRSKSIYRSNGIDPRYNERRPDRYTMEESRARDDKYEKRREDGLSRESDDNWSEYSRQINELRDKIEGKVGGRSEYDNYNSHHQLEWNLKRLGCKSRSPEKYRSHSSSRGSREKEFDKRRSKRSRSTDKFMNAKSTIDERESSKERQSIRVKNFKDFEVEVGNSRDAQPEVRPDFSKNDPQNKATFNKILSEIGENGVLLRTDGPSHVDTENTESSKVTLEKLVSQDETPNGRIAALRNNTEVSSIQSAIPEPAALGSGSFKEEKRREDGSSSDGDNNWSEYSRQIDELRAKIEGNNYSSHHHLDSNLKRLGRKSRSPQKYKSRSDSRKSREKEFDKRRSKRSTSTDTFINAKSTVDERQSGKERQSRRAKNSKDIKVEVENSHDVQPEEPPDFSRNDPPKEVAIDKISSSETVENGSGRVDIENAELADIIPEKPPNEVETPDDRITELKNDSEAASIQSAMPEPAPFGSESSREEKRREGDNNCIEDSTESDELRDKFKTEVGGGSEGNNYNSLKRLGHKSRSPEKDRSHRDSRRSREKEVDKRRSKRSRSTDKCINAKSTVDERESGKKRQSTRAKDSKDIEVEVKNSRDAQPEVPPDFSRNDPPKEVAIDNISSSEIVGNDSSHVDVDNAESAGLTLEKLPSQVETPDGRIAALENDSEVASVQSAMPEPAALGSGSSREEKRREDDNNCVEDSKENDELRDKFESDVGGSSECSLKRLGHKSRSPEKDRSHSGSRRSREKEADKRRSKRSRSTDKCINAKTTVDERESGKKRQSSRAKDSKDIEVEVKNSRDAQPEVSPDFSTNAPKEVAIDKISSSEIAENGLAMCGEEPSHVDIEKAVSAGLILENLVSQVETPDGRIAALETDSEAASIQSAMPEPAALESGSSEEEKRREGDNNCIEHSGEIDELRDKFESNVGSSSECNNANSLKRLGCKSRSYEKDRNNSSCRRSREKEFDKRRSKRSTKSTATDKCINAKSTVDDRESGKERQSTRSKDSKDLEVDVKNSRDVQPEILPDLSKNSPPNEVAIDKISSSEIAKDDLPLCTTGPDHVDIENAESVRVTLEKIVSQVETADRWIADLESDSEVASIQLAITEPTALGSGSFREEKIENIEKFIKDYQENEEPCLPIADRESEEREKLGDSTSSIVDTLSMDVEEPAAAEKSDDVSKNPPEESRTDVKDVAGDTESTIPKPDTPADKCTSSEQIKTLEDKKISIIPEISDKKTDKEKHLTDKVAVLKLTKYRPRIPCPPIMSRYSRRKQSVLADSGSSNCVVKSQSSTNSEADNRSKKEIKTRRIPTEELSVQSSESSAKKSDTKIFIPKQKIEDANILTDKNSNAAPPETKNTTEDSRAREEADCRVESSENNSVSVSSSGNNILHQAETSPELPAKADAAPKLNNMEEPVELGQTRLAQKTTPAAVQSTDSKLSNRKKALPKEVDGRAKPAAKQCNIIVTARRRRPVQLEDSCVARTLVPSVHDVNWNESVKTVCAKAEAPELPKLVSEPAIRGRKRRLNDK